MRRFAIIVAILFIVAGGTVAAVTFAAPTLHTERCAKGGEVIKKGDTLWAFAGRHWPTVLTDNPWMEAGGRVIRKTVDLTIVKIYPGEFVCGVTRKTAPKPVPATQNPAPAPAPVPSPNPNPNPTTGGTAMDFARDYWWLIAALTLLAGAAIMALLGRRRHDDDDAIRRHDVTHHHDPVVVRHEPFLPVAPAPAPPAAVAPAPAPRAEQQRLGEAIGVPGVLSLQLFGTPTGRDFVISSAVVGFTQTPVPSADNGAHAVAAAPAAVR